MDVKGLAISMGIGAAAGAVAIMMMPYNNPTRKFAARTANKVESAVTDATEKFMNKMS